MSVRKCSVLSAVLAAVILPLCGCASKAVTTTAPVSKPASQAPAKEAAAEKFKMPALENPQSWSMIVVPDVQTYIKQIENHGIMDMMLAWIVRRRAEMNIRQVLFTGDLVYHNNRRYLEQRNGVRFFRDGRLADLIGDEQWKAFSRLMERLDGQVPYILCTGNHDYGDNTTAENRKTSFGRFFPIDRNPLTRQQLVECGYNSFGETTLENSAYTFTAPHPDNRKFLVITLQFAPTDADLAWAKKLAAQPRFADHIGIVLTHSYLRRTGNRSVKERYKLNKAGGNAGEGIFRKLVYPSKNIRMVVCGHICSPDNWEAGIAFSTDTNHIGKTVVQMAFNTQAIGGGFSGNGGDGWLRILEFLPDRKTVRARTFSPFFAGSPSTQHLAWRTEPLNNFTFTLE